MADGGPGSCESPFQPAGQHQDDGRHAAGGGNMGPALMLVARMRSMSAQSIGSVAPRRSDTLQAAEPVRKAIPAAEQCR